MLDPQKIAAASLTAHETGLLCAQQNYPKDYAHSHAFYIRPELPGVGCAIGVGLSPELADAAENRDFGIDYDVAALVDAEILPPAPDPLSLADLNLLQRLHDHWGMAVRSSSLTLRSSAREVEAAFLKFARALADNTVTDELRTEVRHAL